MPHHRAGQIERFLDGDPLRTAPRPVTADFIGHFAVAGGRRCKIGRMVPTQTEPGGDQAFRKDAFARRRAAKNQRNRA